MSTTANQKVVAYLEKHRIQEILDVLLNKLCQLQPPDPMGFLATQFTQLVPPVGTVINPMLLRCFLNDLKKTNLQPEPTLALVRSLATPGIDLADPTHENNAQDLADLLLFLYPMRPPALSGEGPAQNPLAELEGNLAPIMTNPREPAVLILACFLAISKRTVALLKNLCKITVVIPLFTNHLRIQPKGSNEFADDFFIRKIKQMEWLCQGSKAMWSFVLVDDGCPHKTGELAKAICNEPAYKDRCSVIMLADAVEAQGEITKGLKVEDSTLGLSVQLGMFTAASKVFKGDHILTYCSTHLSIHLAQTGFLVDAIVNRNRHSHICSPFHPQSFFVQNPPTAILREQNEKKTDPDHVRMCTFLSRLLLADTGLAKFPGFRTGVGIEASNQLVSGSFGAVVGLVGFSAETVLQIFKTPGRITDRKETFDIELALAASELSTDQKESKEGPPKDLGFGRLFLAKVDSEFATMKISSVKGLKDLGLIEKPMERSLRFLRSIVNGLHRPEALKRWEELMTIDALQWTKAIVYLPSSISAVPDRAGVDPQDESCDLHGILFPAAGEATK